MPRAVLAVPVNEEEHEHNTSMQKETQAKHDRARRRIANNDGVASHAPHIERDVTIEVRYQAGPQDIDSRDAAGPRKKGRAPSGESISSHFYAGEQIASQCSSHFQYIFGGGPEGRIQPKII